MTSYDLKAVNKRAETLVENTTIIVICRQSYRRALVNKTYFKYRGQLVAGLFCYKLKNEPRKLIPLEVFANKKSFLLACDYFGELYPPS